MARLSWPNWLVLQASIPRVKTHGPRDASYYASSFQPGDSPLVGKWVSGGLSCSDHHNIMRCADNSMWGQLLDMWGMG